MIKKNLLGLLGVWAVLGLPDAYAQKPNLYICKGANVSLTYKTFVSGPIIVPPKTNYLTLDIGKSRYLAGLTDIETKNTVIGNVKSITIKMVPDVFIKKASFILPDINLGKNYLGQLTSKINFKSQLVLTTIATPFIAGPYIGISNKSDYTDLNCTASLVTIIPL